MKTFLTPTRKTAFGLIAAALIMGIVFVVLFINRPTGFIPTTAEIVDIQYDYMSGEDTYRTIVKYLFNGTEYTSKLDTYSATHQIGMVIDVLVNPNNPVDVRATGMEWLTWLILGLGGASFLGGVGVLVFSFIKPKNKDEFEKHVDPKAPNDFRQM